MGGWIPLSTAAVAVGMKRDEQTQETAKGRLYSAQRSGMTDGDRVERRHSLRHLRGDSEMRSCTRRLSSMCSMSDVRITWLTPSLQLGL